jgi:hypothetical protein
MDPPPLAKAGEKPDDIAKDKKNTYPPLRKPLGLRMARF